MYDKFANIQDSSDEEEVSSKGMGNRDMSLYLTRGRQLLEEGDVSNALEMAGQLLQACCASEHRHMEVQAYILRASCLVDLEKWDEVLLSCNHVLDASNGPAHGQEKAALQYKAVALAKKGFKAMAYRFLDSKEELKADEDVRDFQKSLLEDIRNSQRQARTSEQMELLILDRSDELKLAQMLVLEAQRSADTSKFLDVLRLCGDASRTSPDVQWRTAWGMASVGAGGHLTMKASSPGKKVKTHGSDTKRDREKKLQGVAMLEAGLPVLMEVLREEGNPNVRLLSYIASAGNSLTLLYANEPAQCERVRMTVLYAVEVYMTRHEGDGDTSLYPRRADLRKSIADLRRVQGDTRACVQWYLAAAQDLLKTDRTAFARMMVQAAADAAGDDIAFDLPALESRWMRSSGSSSGGSSSSGSSSSSGGGKDKDKDKRSISSSVPGRSPSPSQDEGESAAEKDEWQEVARRDAHLRRDADALAVIHASLPSGDYDHYGDDDDFGVATWRCLAQPRWTPEPLEQARAWYRGAMLAQSLDDAVQLLDASASVLRVAVKEAELEGDKEAAAECAIHRGDVLFHTSVALLLKERLGDARTAVEDATLALKCDVRHMDHKLIHSRSRLYKGQRVVVVAAQAAAAGRDPETATAHLMAELDEMAPSKLAPVAAVEEDKQNHQAVMTVTRSRVARLAQVHARSRASQGSVRLMKKEPPSSAVRDVRDSKEKGDASAPVVAAAKTEATMKTDTKRGSLDRLGDAAVLVGILAVAAACFYSYISMLQVKEAERSDQRD